LDSYATSFEDLHIETLNSFISSLLRGKVNVGKARNIRPMDLCRHMEVSVPFA